MGFDKATLPEAFRRCMEPEARKALGAIAMTAQEAQAKQDATCEAELHEQFGQWCNLKGVAYVHASMVKKSTIERGWPDFTLLYAGRGCAIEFKAPGGRVSTEQQECIEKLAAAGVPVFIAWDLGSAIRFAIEHLCLPR